MLTSLRLVDFKNFRDETESVALIDAAAPFGS